MGLSEPCQYKYSFITSQRTDSSLVGHCRGHSRSSQLLRRLIKAPSYNSQTSDTHLMDDFGHPIYDKGSLDAFGLFLLQRNPQTYVHLDAKTRTRFLRTIIQYLSWSSLMDHDSRKPMPRGLYLIHGHILRLKNRPTFRTWAAEHSWLPCERPTLELVQTTESFSRFPFSPSVWKTRPF